jgi:hypothetical protein
LLALPRSDPRRRPAQAPSRSRTRCLFAPSWPSASRRPTTCRPPATPSARPSSAIPRMPAQVRHDQQTLRTQHARLGPFPCSALTPRPIASRSHYELEGAREEPRPGAAPLKAGETSMLARPGRCGLRCVARLSRLQVPGSDFRALNREAIKAGQFTATGQVRVASVCSRAACFDAQGA